MPELTSLPAVVLAEQIRNRKLSPLEIIEAHLSRIEQLNPKLNAFVHLDADGARRERLVAGSGCAGGGRTWPASWCPDQHQECDRRCGHEMRGRNSVASRSP